MKYLNIKLHTYRYYKMIMYIMTVMQGAQQTIKVLLNGVANYLLESWR